MKFEIFVVALSLQLGTILALPADEKFVRELSFPYFENEFQLPDNSFPIEYGNWKGELKISKTLLKGFNTLFMKVEFDPKTQITSSSVICDSELGISGNYELWLSWMTPNGYTLTFTGNGTQANSLGSLNIGHTGKLRDSEENGYLEISDLKINISFDAVSFYFENFAVNDFNMDWIWEPLNRFFNQRFKNILSHVQGPLLEHATDGFNYFFQEEKLNLSQLMVSLREE